MEEFVYMPFLLLIFLGEILFFHQLSTSKLKNPKLLFKAQILISIVFFIFMTLSVFNNHIIFAITLLPIIFISGINAIKLTDKN